MICKAMSKEKHSTLSNQPSNQFPVGFPLASIQSNMLSLPVMPGFACSSLSTESTFQFRNQVLAANSEAQAAFASDAQTLYDLLQSDSASVNHTVPGYAHFRLRTETDTSVVDPGLPSGMEAKLCSIRYPAMSEFVVPKENLFQHFGEESSLTSLTGINELYETISNAESYVSGKHSFHSAGLDTAFSLVGSSVVDGNLSAHASLSKGHSFAQDIPKTLLSKFPNVVNPGHDQTVLEITPANNILQTTVMALHNSGPSAVSKNDDLPRDLSASCPGQSEDYSGMPLIQDSCGLPEDVTTPGINIPGITCDGKEYPSDGQLLSDVDLFEGMDLDLRHMFLGEGLWDDIFMPAENGGHHIFSTNVSEHTSDVDKDATSVKDGLFSEFGLRHILNSIGDSKVDSCTSHSSVITSVKSANNQESSSANLENAPSTSKQDVAPCFSESADLLSTRGKLEKIMKEISKGQALEYKDGLWIDGSFSMNTENHFIDQPKKPEESTLPKKRARPGESTRPRPKDRQQIQDRVKELREIVPNGEKCSIDALLARTVNHMLFLQGVIKYADKIKQADEPKMIGEEAGVILRDSPNGGGGGATWAYEVAGQTIVCPITIKELNPPGQMLIEILCEDRGSFLEIADSIRSFGLTILKGVMETHDEKIWAHFLVEANQDVTRMEIFLHLVQLLTKTSGVGSNDLTSKILDRGFPAFSNYQHSPMPIPIGLRDRGR